VGFGQRSLGELSLSYELVNQENKENSKLINN
jgi:hypothetical protein